MKLILSELNRIKVLQLVFGILLFASGVFVGGVVMMLHGGEIREVGKDRVLLGEYTVQHLISFSKDSFPRNPSELFAYYPLPYMDKNDPDTAARLRAMMASGISSSSFREISDEFQDGDVVCWAIRENGFEYVLILRDLDIVCEVHHSRVFD